LLLYIFKALELVSLLLIFAISPLIVFVLFFKRAGQKFNFSDLRANTKLIKSFSGTMGLNRILAVINGRVDIFIMIHFLTAFDTGVFAAAKQVALGVPLVIGSFATVLAPRFSNLKGEKLRKYFNKTIVLSFIISLGIMVGLVVSPLVVYLFGNEYKASLPVLRLLLISFIPFALSTPFVNLLIYGFGKPGLISIMTIFQIAALFAGNLLFVPRFGILTPAYVQIFINLASLTASFSLVQYYLNKKI
jgi:O-antigen/teichoic acid export membrane protein